MQHVDTTRAVLFTGASTGQALGIAPEAEPVVLIVPFCGASIHARGKLINLEVLLPFITASAVVFPLANAGPTCFIAAVGSSRVDIVPLIKIAGTGYYIHRVVYVTLRAYRVAVVVAGLAVDRAWEAEFRAGS